MKSTFSAKKKTNDYHRWNNEAKGRNIKDEGEVFNKLGARKRKGTNEKLKETTIPLIMVKRKKRKAKKGAKEVRPTGERNSGENSRSYHFQSMRRILTSPTSEGWDSGVPLETAGVSHQKEKSKKEGKSRETSLEREQARG